MARRQFATAFVISSIASGRRIATGRDFDTQGHLTGKGMLHLDLAAAESLAAALTGAGYQVHSVEAKPYKRRPYAPFRTTTLQQDAGRKLGFSATRTMSVAQELYEGGFITYMRTDSVTLSTTAIPMRVTLSIADEMLRIWWVASLRSCWMRSAR